MTDLSLRSAVAGVVYVGLSTTLAALAALVEGRVAPAIAVASLAAALVPAVLAFRAAVSYTHLTLPTKRIV